MNKCKRCNKETTNPKFCSRQCGILTNNKLAPKRTRSKHCKNNKCDNLILSKQTYCDTCRELQDYRYKTIADLKNHHSLFNYHCRIREHARKEYFKYSSVKHCQICGYDKTFHVCHIKSIKDFPDSTKLEVVNHPSNLIPLCPNCHWELDHGLLKLT